MKDCMLVLEQFLSNRGVNPEYFKELCLSNYLDFDTGKIFKDKTLENYLKTNDKERFIISGFSFTYTLEGYDFWNELDDEWKYFCENFENDIIYFGFGIDVNINEFKNTISKNGVRFKL